MKEFNEPVDVIFNCADICVRLAQKTAGVRSSSSGAVAGMVNNLAALIKLIVSGYASLEASAMFEMYKSQLGDTDNLIVDHQDQILTLYQIQMGLIDGIIECQMENESFGRIEPLVEKYAETNRLFEDLVAQREKRRKEAEKLAAVATEKPGSKRSRPVSPPPPPPPSLENVKGKKKASGAKRAKTSAAAATASKHDENKENSENTGVVTRRASAR
jgi:hypothetical protein